jgi:hypothetical protein
VPTDWANVLVAVTTLNAVANANVFDFIAPPPFPVTYAIYTNMRLCGQPYPLS